VLYSQICGRHFLRKRGFLLTFQIETLSLLKNL
jgi:hypothetical protein